MTHPASPSRRKGRPNIGWVAGIAAVIAVLTLIAPVTSARSYAPPYSHFTKTDYGMARLVSGCASESDLMPSFDPHSGVGYWSGHATAKSCTGALGTNQTSSQAEAAGAAQIALPVHVPSGSARTTTIAVTWNFSASGGATLSITKPCPTPILVNGTGTSICDAQAVAVIVGDAWLVDLTNGTITSAYNLPFSVGQYNTSENTTTCNPNCTSGTYAYAGGAAFSGSQSATFDISAITDSTHKYAIVTYLGGSIMTEMQGYGGRATGHINMHTGGNYYRLVSVVIT